MLKNKKNGYIFDWPKARNEGFTREKYEEVQKKLRENVATKKKFLFIPDDPNVFTQPVLEDVKEEEKAEVKTVVVNPEAGNDGADSGNEVSNEGNSSEATNSEAGKKKDEEDANK